MAIQVSGTTVINDSRELQNIASLDSTTAATIGAAAGGGGLTELLSDNQSVNGSAIDLDFFWLGLNYDRYIISLTDIRPGTGLTYPRMRLKNSSNYIINSSGYYGVGLTHSNGSYYRAYDSYITLQDNTNGTGYRYSMVMDLWYLYSSTRQTTGFWTGITGVSGTTPREATTGAFLARNSTTIDQHRGIYIYFSSGTIVGNYSIWGQNG